MAVCQDPSIQPASPSSNERASAEYAMPGLASIGYVWRGSSFGFHQMEVSS